MEIIELARQLGQKFQENEVYINFRIAEQNMETDSGLQEKIREFDEKKIKLNEKMSESGCSQKEIDKLSESIRSLYDDIMQCEKMAEFVRAKGKFEELFREVNMEISQAVYGGEPQLFGDMSGYCGGGCSTCSGCR
jgi:cell fate (sporulation/competence/biofilm development) regulator YlbF (YheA/YmcA/DUF963 family)